jgi:DNA-binding MarR family transcriptional regulator
MEVRIAKGETLAGVPMERVRELLRRNIFLFDTATIAADLRITPSQAGRLAKALLRAGYVRDVRRPGERVPCYERTLDGSTLAAATMAPPLRRTTVERLLKDVVERARAINDDDGFAYRVARIDLFGSALGEHPRPGDVDLAVTLSRRYADPNEQERADRARLQAARERGRHFPNITAQVFWAQTEVLLALRRRARGLSLSDGGTPERLGTKFKTIFATPTGRRRSGR